MRLTMQAATKIILLCLLAGLLIEGKTRKHSRPRRWFELLSDCTEEDECFGDHCLHLPPPNNTAPGPEPSPDLFSILGQGLEQIDNYTSTEYGILLLGNTGSGKSTLAQIVAGNLSQVHSVCSSSCTFVIVDENDKIGAPSTKSKTLVPEVIYKPSAGPNETDLPFYDCPGFDDTRGFEMDIAANFFMNRVTKKPAHLKLLFVTPQKVFSTGDRTSFDKLVTHATKFVVDMEKYLESLGLVVTMAPNYNNAGRPVSANTIINGVVEFIKVYMNDQDCANTQDYRQIKKCKFSQKLIENNSSTGKYDRIGFVRIPKDCGPLSELNDMKYARGNITLLYERLQFTKVDAANDFAFTLSDSTLPNVQNYTRSINYNVMRAIDSVTTGFTRAYNTTIQQETNWFMINLQRRQEVLQRFYETLHSSIQAISDLPKIALVLKATRDAFALMDYDVPMAYQDFLEQQEAYMEFFTEVTGEQQSNPDIWLNPLKTLANTIAEYRDWYEFCFSIEETVMSYSLHNNKPSLPTDPNFIDWIDYINRTISRVPSNILSISKKISSSEFNLLGVMLQYVLQPCTVKCQNDSKELYMQQNYFKLSDLSNQITEWISLCAFKPSKVFINVGHTVFLDATRTILTDMDLTLIAPYWVTVGSNKSNEIQLEGSNGINFDTPAKHGEDYTGQFGDHGCAGRIGNQDGSFVAFAKYVSSDANIHINLQTGHGGNGQVGGQGGIGYSRHATADDPKDDSCMVYENGELREYEDHWGFDGDSGGAGGNGGVGGTPGPTIGNITFHYLTSFYGLHSTKRTGTSGTNGAGGKGGLGGAPGDGYEKTNSYFVSVKAYQKQNGPTGPNGKTGSSLRDCDDTPKQPRKLSVSNEIFRYKVNQLANKNKEVKELLKFIDSSPETKYLWSLEGLAEEAYELQKIVNENKDSPFLQELHRRLISRLEMLYDENTPTRPAEQVKVLNVLLAECYNTLLRLEGPSGFKHSVDILPYFSTVKSKIKGLRVNTVSMSLFTELNYFRNDLRGSLDQYYGFIGSQLHPSLLTSKLDLASAENFAETILKTLIRHNTVPIEDIESVIISSDKVARSLHKLGASKSFAVLFDAVVPNIPTLDHLIAKLYAEFSTEPELADRLAATISVVEDITSHLRRNTEYLQTECVHLLKSLEGLFQAEHHGLEDSPDELTQHLNKCKHKLELLRDASLSSVDIAKTYTKVTDFFTMTLNLYQNMHQYNLTMNIAKSIALIDQNTTPVSDPTLEQIIQGYDKRITDNMLEIEIQRATQQFANWVFPFAKYYLNHIPNSQKHHRSPSSIGRYLEQIEYLEKALKRYKTNQTSESAKYIREQRFANDIEGSQPFYTWENKQHRRDIEKLLAGHSITLFADVRKPGLENFDAIKFKLVEIDLRLENATYDLSSEFDTIKDSLEISMSHSGISNYRFSEKYYEIAGLGQQLIFSFKRDSEGNRIGTNNIYEQFKSGDLMLSPFTNWKVKLTLATPSRRGNATSPYIDLEKFAPYVQVDLVGVGLYVDVAAYKESQDDLMLEKYYVEDKRPSFQFQL